MTSARQDQLLESLPGSLRELAIDLSGEGAAEYGFPVSGAQAVFDALSASGAVILGGDLWMADEDGFAPCHEGWFCQPGGSPDTDHRWREFAARIPEGELYYVTFIV